MTIHIFGMHGGYGAISDLIVSKRKTGWIVDTVALKDQRNGKSYTQYDSQGITTLCRLNWGYAPDGTIPAPEMYDEYARIASDFVRTSKGCKRWIVGNEFNMPWEWPNHVPITLDQYVSCYLKTYAAIKAVQPDSIIIPQAFCPWNDRLKYSGNERGDWIQAMTDMLNRLQGHVDAIALHAYSHGLEPSKIYDESKMQAPFQDRYYNFRVYREWMQAIPASMRGLPVFITEANGNEPWGNNTGWVRAAYQEIDWWNQQPGNQQIHALCLYRWESFDKHGIEGRNGTLEDFAGALEYDFRFISRPAPVTASPGTVPMPAPVKSGSATQFVVVSRSGVKIRREPGTAGKDERTDVLRVALQGALLDSTGETVERDGLTWWRIVEPFGWAAQSVNGVELLSARQAPKESDPDWERAIKFVLDHEGGYVNHPSDPGGETKYGISKRSHPDLDIKNLTVEQAKEIYRKGYWDASGASSMEWPLNVALFDFAVNAGVGRAKRTLAEARNDIDAFMAAREAFYRSLSTFSTFGRGWLNRVNDLRTLIGVVAKPEERTGEVKAGRYLCTVTANIRRTPGHRSKPAGDIIGTVRAGDIVNITGETAQADGMTWAQLDRDGRKFWVVLEFLQPFAEKDIKGAKILFPVSPLARISQNFGERPEVYKKIVYSGVPLKGHNGIDFASAVGHDIIAVDSGVVTKAGWDSTGYGNHIQIRHAWGDTVYAHLSQVLVSEGDNVEKGQHIGEMGDTGWSTGPHLHFGLRIAPYRTTDGWGGYIDPLPHLTNE